MTAFILERRTPRQWRLEAATSVKADAVGRTYSFTPLRRSDREADRVKRVMDALMHSAKVFRNPNLHDVYELAKTSPETLVAMVGTSYSPPQSNGRPAMVVVN